MILLKILPKYFKDVESGIKNFEIRKNDRKYEVGKYVCLREFDGEKFTGKFVIKQIQYIYEGSGLYGLSEGYCVLGLASTIPKPQEYEEELIKEAANNFVQAFVEAFEAETEREDKE